MKFVKFIFENEEVRALTEAHSPFIDVASNIVVHYNSILESHIQDNLKDFISTEMPVHEIYENIRNYTVYENIGLYNLINNLISNSTISDTEKAKALTEAEQSASWWAKHGSKVKKAGVLMGAAGATAAASAAGLKAMGYDPTHIAGWKDAGSDAYDYAKKHITNLLAKKNNDPKANEAFDKQGGHELSSDPTKIARNVTATSRSIERKSNPDI